MFSYKAIILIFIATAIGMLLYPPFTATNSAGTHNMGYHFILSPPTKLALVNVNLLLAQVCIASLITIAVCFLKSKDKENHSEPPNTMGPNSITPERLKAVENMLGTSLGCNREVQPPLKQEKEVADKTRSKSNAVSSAFKWAAILSLSYTTIPVVVAVWNGYHDLGGYLAEKIVIGSSLFLVTFIVIFLWNLVFGK